MEHVAEIMPDHILEKKEPIYNRAKMWQIGAFAMNNSATNLFNVMMGYLSYYATGIVGLGVVLVSTLLTSLRIWDAITDPIVGFLIDKTNGKFGKFRPYMIAGFILMALSCLILYNTTHLVPDSFKIIYFLLIYVIYEIGYTFQTAVTKGGQTVLTNDPKQRPLFSTFDMTGNLALTTGIAAYVSMYLIPKYDGFTQGFFTEIVITTIVFSGILTALAVAGIWSKDRAENFGNLGGQQPKVKIKDIFLVLKENRALQTIIIAASVDKLSMKVSTNSVTMVMLFGIVIGNFELYGSMSLITVIPSFIIILIGTNYARNFGSKKALVVTTWLSMISYGALFLLLLVGDPTQISLGNWGFMTIAFLVLYSVAFGIRSVNTGIVIPMIPDIADYELYKNGRYIPGIIGTVFAFVDKLISSLSNMIVGLALAFIGFKVVQPTVDTPYSSEIFWSAMFLFAGVLIVGWILSLISLKFYPLDDKKMYEIQLELNKRKSEENN